MQHSIFDSFTNQYSLTKTLRFELKPEGNTQKMLDQGQIIQQDEFIQMKYQQTKPYFDRLHREFVQEALQNSKLTKLDDYYSLLQNWQNEKKNNAAQKELKKQEKILRQQIIKLFDNKAENWVKEQYPHLKFKKKDTSILFDDSIFLILKDRYGEEPATFLEDQTTQKTVSIFDSWKGFTGYFKKFQETRKNFYKVDGTETAHATRIIDQNLRRFCNNLSTFELIKSKLNLSEVEQNFTISLNKVFSLDFYSQCLLQEGIDFYNKILGGAVLKNSVKQKGINEIINKYRQDNKGAKIPFLKLLDKQILSQKDKFGNEIENDEKLLSVLKEFERIAEEKTSILKSLITDFTGNKEPYHLAEVYISNEAFNTISRRWTHQTSKFEEWLYSTMKPDNPPGLKFDKKTQNYKFPDFIALSYIQTALNNHHSNEQIWKDHYYQNGKNNQGCLTNNEPIWRQFLDILQWEFETLFEKEVIDSKTGGKKKIGYNFSREHLKKILDKNDFSLCQQDKITIKDFADSILSIYQLAKYFAIEKKGGWLNEYDTGDFYENPEFGYKLYYDKAYEGIVQTYNQLRNYLTQKPYSQKKWKLNFENSTLADGWDKNKESDNFAVILRKNKQYYLGLMVKGHHKIFDDRNIYNFSKNTSQGFYEKIVYKYFPDQSKMFPKVCFSKTGLEFFQPSKEIYGIYKNSEFKKGDNFSIQSMQKLIDFYKDCLSSYEGWKGYDFKHLKPTKSYQNNIGEFFRDVAEDGYKITFQNVSVSYIEGKNQKGELYLFQINNKDWNEGSIGTKNLHTLYFESIFSNENIQNHFPIKLNGQAEIFYRPKTNNLEKKEIITQKNKITLNKGAKALQKNRYTENKIFFHVPLTLNRGKGKPYQFNARINNFLANNPDMNIIGIDRGEKHLAYYSVINQKGEILKDRNDHPVSGSLNLVGKDGAGSAVDYHQKLQDKAASREQSRKDWQAVEGIKDLKKGYISQVVRKLADLAIEHNAIIVFEDLNMRFKQIRSGIEKSVYQQLEKALIEKLNYLVNKGEKDSNQTGHLLKAYQLAAPFSTFKDMGKQTGIIFYTQASYTSKIDPVTGWRPNLYLKYTNAEKAKQDILNFSQIQFKDRRFEFTYDLKNFQTQKEYPQKTKWTICSCVERFRWNRTLNQHKGGYEHYKTVTDNFNELFNNYIDFTKGNIKEQIAKLETKGNEEFFKDFIFNFNLICQIRNTQQDKNGDDNDFILSPVEPFFDSRKDNGKNLPKNGDDNGAFNIARKGILILNKISEFSKKNQGCEKIQWNDLYVSNTNWDNYLAKNN